MRTILPYPLGRRVSAAGLLLLLFVFAIDARTANAFDFVAALTHQLTGGQGIKTKSALRQAYRASDGIALDFTDAIQATAGISYNRNQNSGSGTSEVLTPTGGVRLHNDLFALSLSGQATSYRRTDSTPLDTSTWTAGLAPVFVASLPWVKYLHPAMNLSYSESQTTSTGTIDQHSTNYGGSLGLHLPYSKFSYGYNRYRKDDRLNLTTQDRSSHVARLNSGAKLWHNRFTVKFGQSVTRSSETDFGIVPASGAIETPFDFDPATIYAGKEVPGAVSVKYQSAAFPLTVSQDEKWDLVLSVANTTVSPLLPTGVQPQLNQLRLEIASDPNNPSAAADYWNNSVHQNDLTWELFATTASDPTANNGLGVTWDTVAVGPVTFNHASTTPYFQIPLGATLDPKYKNIRIVVTYRQKLPTEDHDPLQIASIKGVSVARGTPGSSYSNSSTGTAFTTGVDMNLRLSSSLQGSSHFFTEYGAGFYNGQLTGALSWAVSPIMTPSMSFYETRSHRSASPDSITRAYTLNLPVTVLPTFNVDFGGTRSEQFSGGEKTSSQNTYTFVATALLYPELTAGLNEAYTTRNTLKSDGTTTKGENFVTDLILQAQLTPRLNCSIDTNFARTFKPVAQASKTASSDLNFNYRPSDMVSLTGRYEKSLAGSGGDSKEFTLGVAVLNTPKTRVTLSGGYQQQGTEVAQKLLGMQAGWDISKTLSLLASASYSMAERNTWSLSTSLYFRP